MRNRFAIIARRIGVLRYRARMGKPRMPEPFNLNRRWTQINADRNQKNAFAARVARKSNASSGLLLAS
jgi:hypothetical protein